MELPAYQIAEIIGVMPHDTSSVDRTNIDDLLTDSRNLTYPSRTVFFALRTEVNDGHNFISHLYARGVRYFVVDQDVKEIEALCPDATFWHVSSVIDALQSIGAYVRRLFSDIPVIGITGSRGKTVVKELIYTALCRELKIVRSPRSYNSQIGVPLSLWCMTQDTDAAIFEAGISQPGEMAKLSEIICPNIGIFTSLTQEHDEGFDSLLQKAHEKALLFVDCPKVLVDAESEHLDLIFEAIIEVNQSAEIVKVDGGNKGIAKAAVQLILAAKDDLEYLPTALEILDRTSDKISSRIDVTETLKNCVIVYDGFTNDARSVYDALNMTLRHLTPQRKLTLILTEPDAPMSNRKLAQLLKAKGVTRFIGVGASFNDFKCDNIKVELVGSTDEFLDRYTISDFADEVILIKGSSASGAYEIKSLLESPRHETVMEVDLGAVTRNFNFFRSKVKPSTGVICMVKAAGYGVGAIELAKTLQAQGAAYLAVAVVDEGVELRRAGISMPIIVMNPIGTNYKALFDNRLEPSVFSLRELDLLLDNAARYGIKDYPVHIKLDTGMHRLGFLDSGLPSLISQIKGQRQVKISSIFSHLATADCLDQNEYTEHQLSTFDAMSTCIMSAMDYPIKRHILNTAGILRYPQYQYDMVRLGIGLYGVAPIDGYKLEPVARLLSTIISIKHWDEGITIGYGRHGVISGPTTVATVAIGYADGLDRHLSNHAAYVLVNGHKCDIIGNICMDQCMIDITGVDATIGDSVEIFGKDAPIERLSDQLTTIPYEILTSVSPRVKRIYFRE